MQNSTSLLLRTLSIIAIASSALACSSSGDAGTSNQDLSSVYAADAAVDADLGDAVASDANAAPDAPTDAPSSDAAADAADGACPCGVVAPYECKLLQDHCAKDPNCLDCKEIPKACACAPCHDGGTHCGH